MLRYQSRLIAQGNHQIIRSFTISCSLEKQRKIPASIELKFRESLHKLKKNSKRIVEPRDKTEKSSSGKNPSQPKHLKIDPPKSNQLKLSSRTSRRLRATPATAASKKVAPRHPTVDKNQHRRSHPLFIPSTHKLEFNEKETPQELFLGSTRFVPDTVDYTPIDIPNQDPVPTLKHKLSRVLFSPGVLYLRDPRTGVYNFNPYIYNLLPNSEFDFSKVTPYIPSSKDELLSKLSSHYGTKYYSSTSSMTGLLSQLHFFISNFKPVNLVDFSKHDDNMFAFPSRSARLPAIVVVKKSQTDGKVYSIDADKSCDREMVLSLLGNSLERLLTLEPEDFDKYKIGSKEETPKESNSYHYARVDSFLLRSQLDCYDHRLPGTGTFDLKTRAVSAVRFDLAENEKNLTGYQLNKQYGDYESFESEIIDLCKSTLLKYSLQARIGNMDGIFLAFHNISKMFGFKYLPLSRIDEVIHSFGLKDFHKELRYPDLEKNPDLINKFENKTVISSEVANREFKLSIKILDHLLNMIREELKDKCFRLILSTEQKNQYESKLKVIATPIEYDEIETLQNLGTNLKKMINLETEQEIPEFLSNHLKMIKNMNDELFRDPLGYEVLIKHEMNGKYSNLCHPILNSVDDKWESLVKIHKMQPEQVKKEYYNALERKVELLVENLQDLNTSGSKIPGIDNRETKAKAKKVGDFDELRAILRLFGEKGKRLHKESEKKPIIWNDE